MVGGVGAVKRCSAVQAASESDPLRDDGAQLEQALKTAGVRVERKVYPGVTHEFFGTAAVVLKTQDAQACASLRLKADLENSLQGAR